MNAVESRSHLPDGTLGLIELSGSDWSRPAGETNWLARTACLLDRAGCGRLGVNRLGRLRVLRAVAALGA
ncbi:MAG TPA: hypothetical protein VGH32_12775, partial [Pirellulales bacterium]